MPTRPIPIALIISIALSQNLRGEFWSLRVRCPYCLRIHTHGNPLDATDFGHRFSHCADRFEGQYLLMPTEDTEYV
ncbi:hypothetical protein [Sinomonas sp. G460-2]|uniref:hypothetical protein n=1 Tax=Sinomonas sp. G460-2 TaxID=3393464 RepID=UPI0039EE1F3F